MIIYASTTISTYLKLKATSSVVVSYPAQYSIGSKVYILASAAEKGVLESVVVKRYIINNSEVFYEDTLNCIWRENELCSNAIARDYALAYWERLSEACLNS